MIDIVNAFDNSYDQRILMTGFLNPRNRKLDDDVKIEKLIAYNRTSSIKRILTWSLAFLKALFLIKLKYRKADLFLVSNPPLTLFIPFFCRNNYSILVYDVYPDAFVEFNILKPDSLIIRLWKRANRKVFKNAEKIFTITDGMRKRIAEYNDLHRIEVVPVWTDNDFFKPIRRNDNFFIREHELEDKFIVMYSGNLGKSHPVERILDIAKNINNEKIYFLIIGEGEKFDFIEQQIKLSSLKNIRLLPWQPTQMLPYTFSSADISVVTLGKEASDLSIPSKTFNFMSLGVPIMGICNENSALSNLIQEYEIGISFNETNVDAMVNWINKMFQYPELREQISKNSKVASNDFTPENVYKFL